MSLITCSVYRGVKSVLPWAVHIETFISSAEVKGQILESSLRIQKALVIHVTMSPSS